MKTYHLKKPETLTQAPFTLMNFIKGIIKRTQKAEVTNSAAILAYYALLSLFPLIILIGNLLPYLDINPEWILPYIETAVPETIYHYLEGTIKHLLTVRNGGLLSIGAIATLWSASRGINAVQVSMNKAYEVTPRKNIFFVRLASLAIILILVVAVVAVVLTFIFGQVVIDYLQPIFKIPENIVGIFQTLKWPVTMVTMFIVLLVLYYLVPNVPLRLKNVLPGAVFTTLGWLGLTQVFAIYVRYFSKSMNNYGAVGTFVVLLLWLNFSGVILSMGAVINAVLDEQLHGKIQVGRHQFLVARKKET